MKTNIPLLAMLAALVSVPAQAQDYITVAPITIALTDTYAIPGLPAKDSEGRVIPVADGGGPTGENNYTVDTLNANGDVTRSVSTSEVLWKPASFKLGNKELIAALADPDAGVLPPIGSATVPSPVGWTLQRVVSGDGSIVQYIARHTTKVSVEVPDLFFNLLDAGASTGTVNTKEVITTTYNIAAGTDTSVRSFVSSGTYKGEGEGSAFGMILGGIFSGSWKMTVKSLRIDNGDGTFSSELVDVFTPQKLSLDYIMGSDGDPELPGIIEGSMSSAPGVIQDAMLYFPVQ
jgi:hypothetical protein